MYVCNNMYLDSHIPLIYYFSNMFIFYQYNKHDICVLVQGYDISIANALDIPQHSPIYIFLWYILIFLYLIYMIYETHSSLYASYVLDSLA